MTRRVMSLFVIGLLVVAVLAVSSDARTYSATTSKGTILHQYSFNADKSLNDESLTATSKPGITNSLGAFTADGGSPGYIIGRSMRDGQAHLNPGRFVGWRLNPQVHFVFAGQTLAGRDDAGIAR